MVDGSGIWELEDKGDRFCGIVIDFPGADRVLDVNPDGGEELKGMFKTGDLRNGKDAGVPLWVSSNSAPSGAEVLGNDTGAVGGVKPDDLGGLDNVRAEGSAPPETPAALKKESCLRIFPGGVSEESDRETFRVIKNN